jgi:hypothetical protein
MICLMQKFDRRASSGLISRRDVLAAALAAVPLTAVAAPADSDRRLRSIVQTYGGEFGPARKGANRGRI